MNHCDIVMEVTLEPPDDLRRKGYLGDKDNRGLLSLKAVTDGFDIHLGLTAPGDPVKKEHAVHSGFDPTHDSA
jgi:hypothetical protein